MKSSTPFCGTWLPLAIVAAIYLASELKSGYVFLAGAVLTGAACLILRLRKR